MIDRSVSSGAATTALGVLIKLSSLSAMLRWSSCGVTKESTSCFGFFVHLVDRPNIDPDSIHEITRNRPKGWFLHCQLRNTSPSKHGARGCYPLRKNR